MQILLKAEKQGAEKFLKALVHDEVPTEEFKNLFDEVLHAEGLSRSQPLELSAAQRAILVLILNNDILDISQEIALFEELYPFWTDYPQAVREAAKVLISHPLGFQIVANKARMEFGNSWAPMDQLSDIPYGDPRSVLEWGGLSSWLAAAKENSIPEVVATAHRFSHNLDEALTWTLLMKGQGIAINTGKVDGVTTEIFRLKDRFG